MITLKNTTQSIIIGKLSSYARKNAPKKPCGNSKTFFRIIYILRYADDMLLRQNVQRALYRCGAYHQLCRAIPHENSGKFRVDTEGEQQNWSECSRPIANAAIFYNSCLLSKLL
ncbi:Tn3 family transposase [Desulfosarcina sp.]|uniref:Tn3 family transposase n=1 Tax=Desulfosarcina sp. TaxID=2027861 RepID=UPI0039B996A3